MRKILTVIIALVILAVSAFADKDRCEHDFLSMSNMTSHYEECQKCFEIRNAGSHTFANGKCTVCGHSELTAPSDEEIRGEGEHEHIFNKTADKETHYEECVVCHERFGVGEHSFENGKCYVCGYVQSDEDTRNVGEHEHKLMKMANAACHYEECQVCFELFDVGDHTFVDGKCSVCGHPELVNPFIDVPEDAWYHDEVVKAVDTGIINGKTATEFKPDDLLTYAEAAKLAACMHQVYMNGEVTLKNGDPWYKPYVDYCMENFIIDGEYDYDANATRAGYMEIFANALPDDAFAEINNIPDGSILDVKDNAPYAIYVYKMYRAGIVTGVDEEHRCNPNANILRCEVATIISRMMDEGKRVRFDMVDPDAPGVLEDNVKVDTDSHPSVVVTPGNDSGKFDADTEDLTLNPLSIYKQPEGLEAESYGIKVELEVQVYGGKAPYTYEWYYNGYRNQKTIIENGDYVKDVKSEALVLSIEKENTLLGAGIYCKITDSEGASVTTEPVKVYGPFSMPVEQSLSDSGKYTLVGRVQDGILKKGEKVSVIRNGKVIAIGTAEDLQMFNKSLDETVKGDNVGIIFAKEDGVRPSDGDIVVKYQPSHKIDTSDIVN